MFYFVIIIFLMSFVFRLMQQPKSQLPQLEMKASPQMLLLTDKYEKLFSYFRRLERLYSATMVLKFSGPLLRAEVIALQKLAAIFELENIENIHEVTLQSAILHYVHAHKIDNFSNLFNAKGFDKLPQLLKDILSLQAVLNGYIRLQNPCELKRWILTLSFNQRLILNFSHTKFSEWDLSNASLAYCILLDVNFTGTNLKGANLESAFLNSLFAEGADLTEINWRNISFQMGDNYNIRGAKIDEKAFIALKKAGVRDFSHVHFIGDFTAPSFKGCIFEGTQFHGLLNHPDFSESYLSRVLFHVQPIKMIIKKAQWMSGEVLNELERNILTGVSRAKNNAMEAMREFHALIDVLGFYGEDLNGLNMKKVRALIQDGKWPNLFKLTQSSSDRFLGTVVGLFRPQKREKQRRIDSSQNETQASSIHA